MASELSKFIEDELKDKGWRVDDEEAPQQALLGALRVEARVKEKQASKKLATWKRGICVGGGIIVVILVWLLIMKLGSTPGAPGDMSHLFAPPPPPAVKGHDSKPTTPLSKHNNSTPISPKLPTAPPGKSSSNATKKWLPKPTPSPAPKLPPKPASKTQRKNDTRSPPAVATAQKSPPVHNPKQTSPPAADAKQPPQLGSPAPSKPPGVQVKPPVPKPENTTANGTAGSQG